MLVFGICTAPVVIWNAQHGWITVTHVAGDAGMHSEWQPTLRYFWDFLFTQAGLLNPIFFVGALWAMFASWKLRRERPLWLYFFCMSAPLFFGYWLLLAALAHSAQLARRRRAADVLPDGGLLE